MKKEHSFKQRIKFYSFLICIPIFLIAIIIKIYFSGPIQAQYVKKHNESVAQEVSYLNQQLGQVEVLSANWGQNLQKQFMLEPIRDLSSFTQLTNITRDLFFFQNSNNLIKECRIFIFDENEPFVIGSSGTWKFTTTEDYIQYQISNGKDFQWRMNDQGEVVFIQDISGVSSSDSKAYLTTVLNKNRILDLLKVSATSEGATALTIDGELIVSTGQLFDSSREMISPNGSDTWKNQVDGATYSFMRAEMSRLSQKWLFYSASPIAAIAEPILRFSNILFLIGLVLFLFAVILGQIIARRQYKPIGQMMDSLFGDNRKIGGDEFEYLTRQWKLIIKRKDELENQRSNTQEKLRQSVLSQILEGKYSYLEEKDLVRLLKRNGWPDVITSYTLFSIRLGGEVEQDAIEVSSSSDMFVLENLIHDIGNRLFEDSCIIEYRLDSLLLFVPNCNQESTQRFVETTFEFVNRVIKKFAVVIVSKTESEISRLTILGSELERLRYYQKVLPENQIIKTTILDNDEKYLYPERVENKIIGKIERSEIQELRPEVLEFVRILLGDHYELGFLKEGLRQLYDKVHLLLAAHHINESNYVSKDILIRKVEKLYTPEKISEVICEDFLESVTLLMQETNQGTLQEAIQKAVRFIQQEYKNPSLSLEETADYVGLEASYLSREFKRAMKINFIDYLTDYRLELSKDLLAKSNLKINEIAEEIGYNSSYFNRLFKKKFDVTPGQYRKKYLNL
ncbi:AraC family transcriptional regulator [Enterococcus timonensis]|uniref:AraC family transcriptional regulator n=1 Tax=Enterococcus timonensis TaxID=1852364 RepID=UPI0008D9EDB4|nr:AraC family transcriptional regulator [Enterococcus timonensis]